jgi:hypothetical protein
MTSAQIYDQLGFAMFVPAWPIVLFVVILIFIAILVAGASQKGRRR